MSDRELDEWREAHERLTQENVRLRSEIEYALRERDEARANLDAMNHRWCDMDDRRIAAERERDEAREERDAWIKKWNEAQEAWADVLVKLKEHEAAMRPGQLGVQLFSSLLREFGGKT